MLAASGYSLYGLQVSQSGIEVGDVGGASVVAGVAVLPGGWFVGELSWIVGSGPVGCHGWWRLTVQCHRYRMCGRSTACDTI